MKHRIGYCVDCNDGNEKAIVAKRCVAYHYWKYRKSLKLPKEQKPRKQIAKVSAKQGKVNRQYSKERVKFLTANPDCQCRSEVCTGIATQCHHQEGRGAKMLDKDKWLAVCAACHELITIDSSRAIAEGWSGRRIVAITR